MERMLLKPKSSKEKAKKAVLMTYSQVVNHLLETYATDNVIYKVDKDILRFTQLKNRRLYNSWTILDEKTTHSAGLQLV